MALSGIGIRHVLLRYIGDGCRDLKRGWVLSLEHYHKSTPSKTLCLMHTRPNRPKWLIPPSELKILDKLQHITCLLIRSNRPHQGAVNLPDTISRTSAKPISDLDGDVASMGENIHEIEILLDRLWWHKREALWDIGGSVGESFTSEEKSYFAGAFLEWLY